MIFPRRVDRLKVPDSHKHLLEEAIHGVFTTFMPDGSLHSSMVWVDYVDGIISINTTRERQKGKNVELNPKTSLLIIDPADSNRYIEIRAKVEITENAAVEHLERLTALYSSGKRYYGDIFPLHKKEKETRIVCRLHPVKINIDAIHS